MLAAIRKTCSIVWIVAPAMLAVLVTACSQSATSHGSNNSSEALGDEALDIETDIVADEFMKLCAVANQLNLDPEKGAIAPPSDWRMAHDSELEQFQLPDLRRKILEIPGGGGRFRDAQQIFSYKSDKLALIANVQQRVDRKTQLRVRSDCVVYAKNSEGLSTCAALGQLIGKAPESNTRMKETGSHFIKWSIAYANETQHFKCSVHAPLQQAETAGQYRGVIVSRITDHIQSENRTRRSRTPKISALQNEDR